MNLGISQIYRPSPRVFLSQFIDDKWCLLLVVLITDEHHLLTFLQDADESSLPGPSGGENAKPTAFVLYLRTT